MRVITFGEILLRLAPMGHKKLFQSEIIESSFCGSEANVAVSLSNYGLETSFVSKVPDSEIGQAAVNALRYFGVDTSLIMRGGHRLGLYYLEKGVSQRPSKVIYDRAYSAFSCSNSEDYDWDSIFEGVDWFHFSGINPALSESLSDISLKACEKAKSKGIVVSCDINYRSKLWDRSKANQVMSELMRFVDIYIGNEEDAESVFNISARNSNVQEGEVSYHDYESIARTLASEYGFKYVAMSLRTSISASLNKWAGLIYSKAKDSTFTSKEYSIDIVDRVGSGDSFAAGIIYSLLMNNSEQDTVDFAVAAGCLKHTLEGDFNRVSLDEVKALCKGDSSGRIKR